MKNKIIASSLACFLFLSEKSMAQTDKLSISGNFQSVFQHSKENEAIGAKDVPEKILMNGFSNVNMAYKNFTAGLRFEYYSPPILGIAPGYEGAGIAYRYVNFKDKGFDITVGNFYDQFGSGLIFRSYEERDLGYDNAMDGVRVKYSPKAGINLKAFVGKQRIFWEYSPGYLRGMDADFNLNEALELKEGFPQINLAASFISRYQKNDNILNIPENVGAYSYRLGISHKGIQANVELAGKTADPSVHNNNELSDGRALLANVSYSTKGFGATISAKHIDNMDFRTDRNASGQNLLVNFNPSLTRPQTWALATFFPYAVNNIGEAGYMAELNYKVPKSVPGIGKMYISANYSKSFAIDRIAIDSVEDKGKGGHFITHRQADWFGFAKDKTTGENKVLFDEFYIEATKKINKKWKSTLAFMNTKYNTAQNAGIATTDETKKGIISAQTVILETKYKINRKKNIRVELQHLSSDQTGGLSEGSWAMGLVEFSTKKYFVALQDLYNYGNNTNKEHYTTLSAGYRNGKTSISATYGKQREGIFCVGGVCRAVPASDGLTLTITSTF
ncbi:MAG: DUF6029 family protein [Flavobacteriales bacterium]|jgi:hypothetical protein|nr:DUF6029 family protein [Flavobacteriales bacterium]